MEAAKKPKPPLDQKEAIRENVAKDRRRRRMMETKCLWPRRHARAMSLGRTVRKKLHPQAK